MKLRQQIAELEPQCQQLQADCNEFQMLTVQLENRIEEHDVSQILYHYHIFQAKKNALSKELENREEIINTLKLRLQTEIQERDYNISQLKERMKALYHNQRATADALTAKIQDG